jgi:NAD(P)-dependent dehydrogenase (short-subunit alcohol dehydrogenase family)
MARSIEKGLGIIVKNKWYDDWIKDIPDLTDKVAIVTGSNSGTGFWAANALASKGCTVVMACRSVEKGQFAKQEILANHPDANLDVMYMDNMDLSSVRSFAKTFHEKYHRLDYLLNNAGIMAQPLIKSKDGFDIQFQTNHLAHFLLTKLVFDKMVASSGQARVVFHSSSAHSVFSPKFHRDQLIVPAYSWGMLGINVFLVNVVLPLIRMVPVDRWLRYGVSKLCNVLTMRELQHKIDEHGRENDIIIAVACHPGYANTALQYEGRQFFWFWKFGNQYFAQSAADGSLPLLHATVGVNVRNGDYFGPRYYATGPPVKEAVRGHGNNRIMATELWEYSEECIGEPFTVSK